MSETVKEPGDVCPSPSLAIALDMFGQVVSYRAACVTDVRWLQTRADRSVPKDLKHHGGRRIDEWMLQEHWDLICRLQHGVYPTRVGFSPATMAILRETREQAESRKVELEGADGNWDLAQMERWIEENASCDRKPLKYKPVGPKRDVRDSLAGGKNGLRLAQAGFLTVMNLLQFGGWGHRPMPRKFASLVVWLHAATWYVESEDPVGRPIIPEHSIEDWCARNFGRFGGDHLAKEIDRYSTDYRLWLGRGGRSPRLHGLEALAYSIPIQRSELKGPRVGAVICQHLPKSAKKGAICMMCAARASQGAI